MSGILIARKEKMKRGVASGKKNQAKQAMCVWGGKWGKRLKDNFSADLGQGHLTQCHNTLF